MPSSLSPLIPVIYDYTMSRPKIPETPEELYERKAFAVMVRMFRGAVGWSQQELADQLGLSKASIAKLELGIMRLAPENKASLQKIIKETGVKWGLSSGTLTIAAPQEVISKLDQQKALSLPTKTQR